MNKVNAQIWNVLFMVCNLEYTLSSINLWQRKVEYNSICHGMGGNKNAGENWFISLLHVCVACHDVIKMRIFKIGSTGLIEYSPLWFRSEYPLWAYTVHKYKYVADNHTLRFTWKECRCEISKYLRHHYHHYKAITRTAETAGCFSTWGIKYRYTFDKDKKTIILHG